MVHQRGAAVVSPILLSLTLLVWLPGASTTLVAHEPVRFGSEPVVQASALEPAATPPTESAVGAPEFLYFSGQEAHAQGDPQAELTSSAVALRTFNDAAERVRRAARLDAAYPLRTGRVLAGQSDYTQTVAPEVALAQVEQVAGARGLPAKELRALVAYYTDHPLGLFGRPIVNLRLLNHALDHHDATRGS